MSGKLLPRAEFEARYRGMNRLVQRLGAALPDGGSGEAMFSLGCAWVRLSDAVMMPDQPSGLPGMSTLDVAKADFHTALQKAGLAELVPLFEGATFWLMH